MPTLDLNTYRSKISDNITYHWGKNNNALNFKMTIIIPTLNCADLLESTLSNIKSFDMSGIEVIIADGGSKDDTIRIIKDNYEIVTKWLSAKDTGISEAFNRGLALAQGKIVQILNAGDSLGNEYIEHVFRAFQTHPETGFVYGNVIMVNEKGKQTRLVKGRPNFQEHYFDSMFVCPHPAMAVRLSTYERVGIFDENIRYAMDFDWIARCVKMGIVGVYSPKLISFMLEGGSSNKNAIYRDWENFTITIKHKTMPTTIAVLRFLLKLILNNVQNMLYYNNQKYISYRVRNLVDLLMRR